MESIDSMESTEALNSMESMGSMESIESMGSMDSMDSMGSMESMDSMDSMDSMESMESLDPTATKTLCKNHTKFELILQHQIGNLLVNFSFEVARPKQLGFFLCWYNLEFVR